MPLIAAAILAGGQARRLRGVDKSSLRIGSSSILLRQMALLRHLPADAVIVTSDVTRFVRTGLPVLPDRIGGLGALGGLYTALADATRPYVLVMACDMPFLTLPFLTRLVQLASGSDGAIPRDRRGRHPLCAVYRRDAAAHLGARIAAGERRVREAVDGLRLRELAGDELAAFDPTGMLLANVNTPDDYAQALGSEAPDAEAYRT